ncbi:NRDE family protein [Amphritea balenae]|uniref:NRDE family protein n=1 Tax=Amphritea balenae TaxID=452629 RepID=A0A3P1SKD6_9GAMM|nr:NRDE family protein [Amphritea balenae]RRC97608.1 hypothetical protein EHS89_17390 [Amphritea balenae]GGK73715.1 hypothetical protein GCM10007941_24730 [Amphritea balenae]
MCTVSWLVNTEGYQLFFNRDEQRSRSKALPPQQFQNQNVAVLMPIDPDGGGSWISVNNHGLSLCLLNFYQGRLPGGILKSRGQLLKALSSLTTEQEISIRLSALNLHQYAPFTLLTFTLENQPQGFQWDGNTLTILSIHSPITSSSVEFDRVYSARQANYLTLGESPDADQLLAYHQSHQTSPWLDQNNPPTNKYLREKNGLSIQGEQSVCMHRDDAETVSLSHIEVTQEKVCFNYIDGSPCELQPSGMKSLLVAANQNYLIRAQ